jgi:hypothetical protein
LFGVWVLVLVIVIVVVVVVVVVLVLYKAFVYDILGSILGTIQWRLESFADTNRLGSA